MVTYIIKAILFSALLLAIYHLFLEKEKMHRFNRLYLLMSIVLPFAIPLVSIETGSPLLSAFQPVIPAVEKTAGTYLTELFLPGAGNNTSSHSIYGTNYHYDALAGTSHEINGSGSYNNTAGRNEEDTLHGNITGETSNNSRTDAGIFRDNNQKLPRKLLLFVYITITTGLFFRFSKNILAFRKKIKRNRSVPYHEAKLVLTNESIIPYSFLNYIFVNGQEYKNGTIEPAVLGHELTHIRQKHTLDILFFELVRIFGWINPFLPLYRNALRLNHEFLADECVVREYCDQVTYQMLLFKTIRQENRMALSSPFNYLFTKKRLIMMSKKESSGKSVSKQIALIPVTGFATLLFLNITVAADSEEAAGTQIVTNDIIPAEADIGKEVGVKSVIDQEGVKRGSDSDSNTASPALSPPPSSSQQEQDRSTRPRIQPPPPLFSDDFIPVPPTSADLKSFQWPDYLVFIDGYMQNRNILEYYQETDFAHYHVTENNTENSVSFVYFLTHEYYLKNRGLKPEQLLPPGAEVSAELLEEYEKIIRKYTPASMTGGEQSRNIRENISLSDKSRLEEIYLQMSVEQRTDQRVIFRPYPVVSRSVPTSIQFESFKDPKLYGVWIDGNRVDNSALENYSHTDFARMSISTLMKNAVNYGEHVYQLNLMTNSHFEDFRDRMSGRTGNMLIYRIRVNQDEASELQQLSDFQCLYFT